MLLHTIELVFSEVLQVIDINGFCWQDRINVIKLHK